METRSPVRSPAGRIAAILACVVLPLATLSVWLDQRVTETDGYVSVVGPLAEDRTVQHEVAARLEAAVIAALPLDQLPEIAAENATRAVHTVVLAILTSPAFPPAWREANRLAHTQLIRALRGDSGAVGPDGKVSVDLAPIVDTVLGELEARGLFAGDVDVQASFAVLDADQLHQARRGYRLLNALGLWLPVAWLVLVVVALLLSPRRGRTLGTLALGSLAAMGALLALLTLARGVVVDAVPSADQRIAGPVWDVVTSSLRTGVLVMIALAGALLVGRLVARLVTRGG